jgi:hypothetical protein
LRQDFLSEKPPIPPEKQIQNKQDYDWNEDETGAEQWSHGNACATSARLKFGARNLEKYPE